jgi:hypothetical protein
LTGLTDMTPCLASPDASRRERWRLNLITGTVHCELPSSTEFVNLSRMMIVIDCKLLYGF